MEEKIVTLHPQGKEGVNIDRKKYDVIRGAILDIVAEEPGLTFKELVENVDQNLDDFQGSIPWYVTTVKLDLEARGLIERLPKSSPQRLRLVS